MRQPSHKSSLILSWLLYPRESFLIHNFWPAEPPREAKAPSPSLGYLPFLISAATSSILSSACLMISRLSSWSFFKLLSYCKLSKYSFWGSISSPFLSLTSQILSGITICKPPNMVAPYFLNSFALRPAPSPPSDAIVATQSIFLPFHSPLLFMMNSWTK